MPASRYDKYVVRKPAIVTSDYPVIQGITFFLVLSVATAILIIDLVYPRLDPRITYGRR